MKRIMSSNTCVALLFCLALGLVACSKETDPPPTAIEGNAPASNDAHSALKDPRLNPPAVKGAGSAPTAVVIPSDPTAALNALTQAARKYSFEKRQPPASVEELATAGYVQSLPQPPAGKKFVIDKKRMVVELANQ
jgi:hypothetical protein